MVAKKTKKAEKKGKEKEDESGVSLDDAFGDDEDVEYAPPKPVKERKKAMSEEEIEEMVDEAVETIEKMNSHGVRDPPEVKGSKPIAKVKKGDKMKIDGIEVEVDAHYVLMNHGSTKEMAIEVFDKNDKDYQIRYFDDQVESTLEVYELQEILYVKKAVKKVEW